MVIGPESQVPTATPESVLSNIGGKRRLSRDAEGMGDGFGRGDGAGPGDLPVHDHRDDGLCRLQLHQLAPPAALDHSPLVMPQ